MAYQAPSLDHLRDQAVGQLQSIDVDRWRRRVAVAVCLVLGVGFGVNRLFIAPPGPPPESYLPRATPSSTVPAAPPVSDLKVHVAGAVTEAGVVNVSTTARVADAIAAAGGLSAEADPDRINLAAKVTDGQRIYVMRRNETVAPAVSAAGGSTAADDKEPATVSLNSATAKELEDLPGVGPATAAAIVAYRQQKGGFTTVDEVGKVKGIGPAKMAQMKPLLVL